ncbi:hypothetical protein SNE40_013565 [Patella caerulea]|uniref:Uncharacterized protein n=1 Tax=Patella caerulea TaxID=87958 RepID=A0AAN8JIH3_PATCE
MGHYTSQKRVKYTTYTEIVNQTLFYNPNILLNSKPLYFPNYVSKRLRKIYDISYVFVPGLLPTHSIIDCFDLDEDSDDDCKHEEILTKQYKQIVASLPRDWVDFINTNSYSGQTPSNLFIEVEDGRPHQIINFHQKSAMIFLGINMYKNPREWQNGFKKATTSQIGRKSINFNLKSTDMIENDYKIVHDVIWTKEKLYNIGKIDSPYCKLCKTVYSVNNVIEDLKHIFLNCKKLNSLQELVKSIISRDRLHDVQFKFLASVWIPCQKTQPAK